MAHSDRVIKLYDFEETPSELKLVLEAGLFDLSTILKKVREKSKLLVPEDVKFYWAEMLYAVKDIHAQGKNLG